MDKELYKSYLLSSIPSAKIASGGKEINCRCFECPDSNDPKSAHFYISIPQNENEPSFYHCMKCHCGGIVTHKKLLSWGIYDKDIAADLMNYNAELANKPLSKKYFQSHIYYIHNSGYTINANTEYKRNYVCNRIGYDFSYADLNRLKIIVDLESLLKENHIIKLTRDERIIRQLSLNFVGFLSIDNVFLNMRRICDPGIVDPSIDKRYENYQIFDKFDTSQRFYTIPTKINLTKPNRIKIHLAEGPFDILSIYTNVRQGEEGIYCSVSGSNYMNNILYFLSDIGLPYIELHLYPDNDQYGDNHVMEKLLYLIPDPTIPIYIHRNMYPHEKDFGVPARRIKESISKLR